MPRLPEGSPLVCPLCGAPLATEFTFANGLRETLLGECHGWSAPLSAFALPEEVEREAYEAKQETVDAFRFRRTDDFIAGRG